MPGPTTEVLATDLRDLTGRLDKIAEDVQALRRHSVRVNTLIGVVAAALASLGALGLFTLNGVIALQRDLGRMDATLSQHARQFEGMGGHGDRLAKLERTVEGMGETLKGIDGRLGRIEGQLSQIKSYIPRIEGGERTQAPE